MIVDSIENADRYFAVHPLFEAAFTYIRHTDFSGMNDHKLEVAGGLRAIISDKPGKTREASMEKFECHNANIDIQYLLSGEETIGWKQRSHCTGLKEPYNEEKDVSFYSDAPDTWLQLSPGQFAVFFPEDVHAPMIGHGNIKKLVLKVKI